MPIGPMEDDSLLIDDGGKRVDEDRLERAIRVI